MKTRIHGTSNDMILIDGEVIAKTGYFDFSEKGVKVEASDGTVFIMVYKNEEWKITMKNQGNSHFWLIPTDGRSGHIPALFKKTVPYSDVLILNEGIEWVRVGRKTFKRKLTKEEKLNQQTL